MKKIKHARLYLAFLLTFMLVLPVSAAEANLTATRSIDTAFDLNFAEYKNWTIDFDNEAGWFHFNHKFVDVFYESYVNVSSAPSITVRLQKLVNGNYETVETRTFYIPGRTITFELPNGGTLTNYRLYFSSNSNATCTLSVVSYNK